MRKDFAGLVADRLIKMSKACGIRFKSADTVASDDYQQGQRHVQQMLVENAKVERALQRIMVAMMTGCFTQQTEKAAEFLDKEHDGRDYLLTEFVRQHGTVAAGD